MVVDWSQFWPSMIATFVGFALALFGEWIIRVISKQVEATELKNQLSEEIVSVIEKINTLDSDKIEDSPLRTPIWKAAINSNAISVLDKKQFKKFLLVYDAIEEYNSWFSRKTELQFKTDATNRKDFSALEDKLNERIDELGKLIKDIYAHSLIKNQQNENA